MNKRDGRPVFPLHPSAFQAGLLSLPIRAIMIGPVNSLPFSAHFAETSFRRAYARRFLMV